MSEVVKPTLEDDEPSINETSRIVARNVPKSHEPLETPRTPRHPAEQTQHSILLVMVVVLVLTNSINYVLYVRLASDMKQFTWFLATIAIPVAFQCVCWPIVWYKLRYTADITPDMRTTPARYFIVCGFLDFVGNLLVTIPAPFVPGPVQVVVSQAILPVNMLFSYLVLHTRYKWSHYLGALLILSGVLVAAHAALTATSTKAYWVIIQMSATIPASISNVVKEKGLKDLDLDVWYFNGWVSTYQLLIGLVSMPLVFVPVLCGREEGPIPPDMLPDYLAKGTLCFFGSSVSVAPATDHCSEVPIVFIVFLFFNVAFNVFLLLTFKHGTSTLAVVASALRVALSAFAFSIPWLAGPALQPINADDIVALFILLLGLAIYQWWPETAESAESLGKEADRTCTWDMTVSRLYDIPDGQSSSAGADADSAAQSNNRKDDL